MDFIKFFCRASPRGSVSTVHPHKKYTKKEKVWVMVAECPDLQVAASVANSGTLVPFDGHY